MNNDLPPRPDWTHKEVKTAAVAEFFDDVKSWAKALGAIPEDAADKELRAVVTLAVLESPDAYEAGRYLEDFIGWPVNGELIRILDNAYRRMPFLAAPVVHAWVMQNNVRFSAKKGEYVLFRVGDVEVSGTCAGTVAREALGFVEVRAGGTTKTFRVYGEDVVKTAPALKKAKPSGPPWNGGTPVAKAMGE